MQIHYEDSIMYQVSLPEKKKISLDLNAANENNNKLRIQKYANNYTCFRG